MIISSFDSRGKGYAMLNELRNLKDDYAVWFDADGQYSISEEKKLEDKNFDVVFGYRDWKQVPLRHIVANKLMTGWFNLLFRSNLKDVACGVVGMNKRLINFFLLEYHGGGYEVDVVIKAIAVRRNLKIKEVEMNVTYENKSSILKGIRIVSVVMLNVLIWRLKQLIEE